MCNNKKQMNSLVKDSQDFLKDLNVNVLKYFNNLWNEPKTIAALLLNSDNEDVKNILAPFFCHNFYQNILSPYTVEENLLFIISIMLKEEINKLNSIEQLDIFLNETPCGYLLEELRRKSDIKSYSKTIIYKILEEIETNNSEKQLNINIENVENNIKNIEKELKKKNMDLGNLEDIIFLQNYDHSLRGGGDDKNIFEAFKMKNKKQDTYFNDKFISNLDKNELEKMGKKYKNEKDMNMYEYILKNKNKLSENEKLFSNEKLVKKIFDSNHSSILYFLYQMDFLKIIKYMDLFLDSIIDNIKIMPKSIKYICKIISSLIKRKFPKIFKVDLNAFIGKFLFINLFIPIFKNPLDIYFNDFIISQNTIHNLRYILNIFTQFVQGIFFFNNNNVSLNYTPFNWYFINNISKVFTIFENIINIKLPNFIDKFINDQLPEDYNYEYFNENPEQLISHKSICFTLNDLSYLLKNMNKCQNILFSEFININNNNGNINNNNNIINNKNDKNKDNLLKLYRIFNKLNSQHYRDTLKNLKELNDFEMINDNVTTIPNIVLIYELLINPKYEKLFNMSQKKPYFYLKELNQIKNNDDLIKNEIIKTKNYFCGLLYNCRDLEKSDFCSKNNTLELLKEIMIFLKSNEFVIDNTLPFEWYIKSLMGCLGKMPKNLTENDYELLYNELEYDINKSIEFLDFYKMSDCFGKIKYIQKGIDFYLEVKKNIIDIDLNLKVRNIIENRSIPVEMSFKFNNREKEFLLLKPTIAEHKMEELTGLQIKKNKRICLNIEQFIKYFPNFVKMQLKDEIEILSVIDQLQIPKKLNDYIFLISNNINKDKLFNKEEFIKVKAKIFDYILNKLYNKLYPAYPEKTDIIILRNCFKLSWTESKHFIEKKQNKENNYDIFMDDIKQNFTNLEKEKSPRKKLIIIDDIFKTISNIISFNGQDEKGGGADDLMAILLYLLVRVQPKKIYSDIEYVKLFMLDKTGAKQYQIVHLSNICEIMKNISHEQLYGVTQEEFNQKCNLALNKNN